MTEKTHTSADEISIRVNGVSHQVHADRATPLSGILRDELGLTGTKIGCEAGDCGACTVLINGCQSCSCLVPVGQCEGESIVTVEGAHESPVLQLLQQCFLEHGAAQCGICTPGMLMSATELLQRETAIERKAIEDTIAGTLCRCTGYVKIVDAIADAAHRNLSSGATASSNHLSVHHNLPLPHVGKSIIRVDGEAKVTGIECYAADMAPEDSLWLRIVRSPHAHATFTLGSFDSLHDRYPGLTRVLTAADVPGHNGFGIYPTIKEQPVFAEERVLYRGDSILGLVGDRDTVDAITWEELPIDFTMCEAITSMEQALAPDAYQLHPERPNNILIEGIADKGDVTQFELSDYVEATGVVETSFVEHAYIEPEAGYAVRVGDRVEVFATTQAPAMDLEEIANILGIDLGDVRIIPSACGGGFGGKLDVSVQASLAVAAWVLDAPVRTVLNRVESMVVSTKRHPATIRATALANQEGRLVSFTMAGDYNTGAYSSWGPTVAGRVPLHCTGPYSVPNVYCRTRAVHTNLCPSGAFRGFGTPQAAIASEIAYDELAEKIGMDRLEFRHLNAFRVGDKTPSGQRLDDSVGMVDCLDAVRNDWETLLEQVENFNSVRIGEADDGLRLGAGIACMWYGCGNTGLSNPSTIRVELDRAGKLIFYNGAVDIGQGSSTVLLQICADAVGLPIELFESIIGDTDLTDDAGKTSASRQTFVSGKAAFLAGQHLREQLVSLLGADETSTLSLFGPKLTATNGDASWEVDLSTVDLNGNDHLAGSGTFDPPITPLDEKGQGNAYATYAFAVQICSVEVDTRLGKVKPIKFVAAHDVGRAINPQLVEGQIQGGIVQGIGMALMEEYIPGKTDNLHDYLIPTAGDIPEIEIKLIEAAEPLGPYGAKGVGEPALVPTPAAVLSAIRHATGVSVDTVPVLPHRLLAKLGLGGETGE